MTCIPCSGSIHKDQHTLRVELDLAQVREPPFMCLGNEASLGTEGGVEEKGPGVTVGGALQSSIHPLRSSVWAQGGLIPQELGH